MSLCKHPLQILDSSPHPSLGGYFEAALCKYLSIQQAACQTCSFHGYMCEYVCIHPLYVCVCVSISVVCVQTHPHTCAQYTPTHTHTHTHTDGIQTLSLIHI